MNNYFDIVVVGGGPAGITASLYGARAGKSVMLLESNAFGGQIATAPRVENFPGEQQIVGADLAEKMFEQATSHGVQFDMGTATVQKNEDGFCVQTEYATYTCKAVVLATGVSHKHLGVDGESALAGNGVCYCAVCDGAFYRGQDVCVVGDGNSAVQYALFLADICSHVTLLTLTNKLFCDKALADRLVANNKITWTKGVAVKQIVGDSKVTGVAYQDDDGAITYLDTNAVFVAIGQQPHNESFANVVQLDEKGYVVADESCTTSTKGIFVAGDCRTKKVRQCATAVGDGAIAGFSAAMYVDANK